MKKVAILIFSFVFVLVTIIAVIVGCQKKEKELMPEDISLTPQSIPRVLTGATLGELKIPDGSTTEVLNNGSTVRITFPKGVYLVGFNKSGEIFQTETIEYSCIGDCTKGCDVFYVQNTFGCSQCQPSTIACIGKSNLPEVEGVGFVNYNAGITFIKDKKEAMSLFSGPDNLFSIPVVQDAMKAFNLKIHGTENPDFSNDNQFKEVGLNLFGCLVIYLAPSKVNPNFSKLDLSEGDLIDASNWSCKCNDPSGSSGCTKDSGIGYKRCLSGACKSCSMIIN